MKLETALLDAETEEDRQTRAKTECCEFVCIIVIADEEKDENHINFPAKISSQRNH